MVGAKWPRFVLNNSQIMSRTAPVLAWPSSKLKDVPNLRAVEYVKTKLGVDLSERDRRQLTPGMIDDMDLAIIIHDKAEWPDYLKEDGKVVFWDIPDTPGMDDEAAGKLWDQVQLRVKELVQEIG